MNILQKVIIHVCIAQPELIHQKRVRHLVRNVQEEHIQAKDQLHAKIVLEENFLQ